MYELEIATSASVVVAIVAVAGYLSNRGQIKMLSKAVDALVSLARSQGKQVGAIESLAGQSAIKTGQAVAQQDRALTLKERELALRKQQADWNTLVLIGKALGWAWDRGLFDEDDEG